MKKHLLFVALATIFSLNVFADAAKPTTVPSAPTVAEEHVMALFCNHYEGNTLNFAAQGWGSAWEVLDIEGTKVVYTAALAWDCVMNGDGPHDLSAYEHLHFDLWAPAAAKVYFTVEATEGFKEGVEFSLNEGWNTIDADPAWWKKDDVSYDWKNLKCIIFERFSTPEGESFEGNPFAFANVYFWSETTSVTPPDKPAIAKPETVPAAPNHDVADVMAMYCNHYAENNLNFNVLGWGGILTWETLDLEGTNVLYCQDMKWEMMTNWDADSYDFSEFEKFHFDVWVPAARHLKVTFEALNGWKHGIDFKLNEGWNTIDADPAWWISEEAPYDWKDVKYIAFEGYKNVDADAVEDCTSAEGTPFAFTNLYWWKTPAVNYPAAPANPAMNESHVMALFAKKYQTNTLNFAPTSWGTQWSSPEGLEGVYFYTPAMAWDAFTNWDANHYDLNAFDMFSCDIWVTVDASIKITFEALKAEEGGSGWKNGLLVEGLKANQWNHVTVDLLNAPYDSFEFTDMRYLILEGFTSEGTPLGITNAYFWDSMYAGVEDVTVDKVAVKRIIDGQIVIEKNGVRYNMLGTQF